MKEKFLSKWSNWWILTRDAKQLNKAFAKELNELIEREVALRQPPAVGRSEQLVCVHPYDEVYQSETECYCEKCGKDLTNAI